MGVRKFEIRRVPLLSTFFPLQIVKIMNRNSVLIGLLIGLVLPFVGYAILLMIYDGLESAGALSGRGFSANFRQRTLGIVAICLNLIPLNFFRKSG